MTTQEVVDKINTSQNNLEVMNIFRDFINQSSITDAAKVYNACKDKIVNAILSAEYVAATRDSFVKQIKLPGES